MMVVFSFFHSHSLSFFVGDDEIQFNKTYYSSAEYFDRMSVFKTFHEYIESHNSPDRPYKRSFLFLLLFLFLILTQ